MNREAIYQAAFALASGVTDGSGNPVFVTACRRFKTPDQVPPSERPAIFQLQRDEAPINQKMGLPTALGMGIDLYIYLSVSDPNEIPSQLLNPVLDALAAVFEPDPAKGKQTLGGLVTWARVAGKIEIFEGVMGGGSDVVAVVPVDILAPA